MVNLAHYLVAGTIGFCALDVFARDQPPIWMCSYFRHGEPPVAISRNCDGPFVFQGRPKGWEVRIDSSKNWL
jgi:hypothetical protein